jgi:signal peptidase I
MPGHTASGEDDRTRASDDEATAWLPGGRAGRSHMSEAEAAGVSAEAPPQSATQPHESDAFSVQPRRRFRRGNGKPERTPKSKGAGSFLRELPVLLLIAFVLALLIKSFLVQAFYIPSESMEPTLLIGDRVLVNKVVYHLHPPRRGDIIVFEDPHPAASAHRNALQAFAHWLTQGLGVSSNPEKDFIKRVIALPGETIEIKRGEVFINGKKLAEPYLGVDADLRDFGPVTVPARNLFVMGDNRPNSNDSRFGLKFIPYDKVVGRAFVIIWPPSRIRLIHTVGY